MARAFLIVGPLLFCDLETSKLWSGLQQTIFLYQPINLNLVQSTYTGRSCRVPWGNVVCRRVLSTATVTLFCLPNCTYVVISPLNGRCPISCFMTECPLIHCNYCIICHILATFLHILNMTFSFVGGLIVVIFIPLLLAGCKLWPFHKFLSSRCTSNVLTL